MEATTRDSRRSRFPGAIAACCIAALLHASSAAAAPPSDPPLVRAFPSFSRAPRIALVSSTPLEPLSELERRARAEVSAPASSEPWLWIKRDDLAGGLV